VSRGVVWYRLGLLVSSGPVRLSSRFTDLTATTRLHSDLDNETPATLDRSRKVSQGARTAAMFAPQSINRAEQLAALGRPPPQRQRSASLSHFGKLHALRHRRTS
jgi:hypothetical protein